MATCFLILIFTFPERTGVFYLIKNSVFPVLYLIVAFITNILILVCVLANLITLEKSTLEFVEICSITYKGRDKGSSGQTVVLVP
jgi:hypothetical protein